ncbi:MAG: FHA domain-containing protein [Chloroflexota bacterium]
MTGPIVLVLRLLAAAALYTFLAIALWMMWQELRRTAALAAGHKVPPIRLEVSARGARPVVRFFTQTDVILGRDPLCDVPLSDKAISARHARLSFHDGQWWVDDLGSTNGTRLNRERVLVSTVLTSGDEIKCGSAKVLVTLPGEDSRRRSRRGEDHD